MKFIVKKVFGKLVPVYNSDAEALKASKLKEGEEYEVEIKRKRNYLFHKKYFALLNLCYDIQEYFNDISDLREYLTCKAGYYEKIPTPDGEMIKAKSISFAKMDDIEFEDLYQKTIQAVCNFLDVGKDDLINEIVEFM